MSGFVGDLSPQQAEVLDKFRETVKDVLKPNQGDHFLLRWLRARDFNMVKAETLLRDAIIWRQEIGADTILEDYQPLEVLEIYRTGGLNGRDKTGCPIYIDPYGLIDMKGILRSVKKHDVMRKYVHQMETAVRMCEEESQKTGVHHDQMLIIYDLKGLGLKHLHKLSVDMYLSIVQTSECRYPEVLKRVYTINSPKIFPIIWSLVRPLLHENTAKKVVVCSGNYKEALSKDISPDQLPACYGGTMTDPDGDPRCRTVIRQGGPIPKEFYNQSVPHAAMLTANISRGSTVKLEYVVHKANSILRYEFQTEGYDVGFGVFRKNSSDSLKSCEMDVVLTTQRSNSHLVPEDGAVECDMPGVYVVRFDNTYSWARSKKVHYIIEILEPDSKSNIASKYSVNDDDCDDEFVMAQDTASMMEHL